MPRFKNDEAETKVLCPLCKDPRPMTRHHFLYRHLEQSHAKASHECLICGLRCCGRKERDNHIRDYHTHENGRNIIRKLPRGEAIFRSEVNGNFFKLTKRGGRTDIVLGKVRLAWPSDCVPNTEGLGNSLSNHHRPPTSTPSLSLSLGPQKRQGVVGAFISELPVDNTHFPFPQVQGWMTIPPDQPQMFPSPLFQDASPSLSFQSTPTARFSRSSAFTHFDRRGGLPPHPTTLAYQSAPAEEPHHPSIGGSINQQNGSCIPEFLPHRLSPHDLSGGVGSQATPFGPVPEMAPPVPPIHNDEIHVSERTNPSSNERNLWPTDYFNGY